MKNNLNKADTGFRFPADIFARTYVAEPSDGIIVRLMMIREDDKTTLQMDIMQELETGLMRIIARRFIPCVLDDDSCLLRLDDNCNIPIRYRNVSAGFHTNSDGLIELQIKHKENDTIVIDRFTN